MSYQRVIPRDLFNEAKLLKCLGQVALLILDGDHPIEFEWVEDETCGFVIGQDESGELYCSSLLCRHGEDYIPLLTPLNSREPYPLFTISDDEEIIEVLTDQGKFTQEFLRMIRIPGRMTIHWGLGVDEEQTRRIRTILNAAEDDPVLAPFASFTNHQAAQMEALWHETGYMAVERDIDHRCDHPYWGNANGVYLDRGDNDAKTIFYDIAKDRFVVTTLNQWMDSHR